MLRMKLGTWALWQVGVYAPGTAKITTLRPAVRSPRLTSSGPSAPNRIRFASGSLSPVDMVMVFLPG